MEEYENTVKEFDDACCAGKDKVLSFIKSIPDFYAGSHATGMLLRASRNQHWEIVSLLIKMGGYVHGQGEYGFTPLLIAASEMSLSFKIYAMSNLIDAGANVNQWNRNGDTPLLLAASVDEDNTDTLRYLIERGADVNHRNRDGDSALMRASFNKIGGRMVSLLIIHGADINAKNRNGDTALIRACSRGCADIVLNLIQRGADVNIQNEAGDTALAKAQSRGKNYIVDILIDNDVLQSLTRK